MPNITVTISGATANDIRDANFILAEVNQRRVSQGLPEFTNAKQLLEDRCEEIVKQWKAFAADARLAEDNYLEKYRNASDADRDEIKAILNR